MLYSALIFNFRNKKMQIYPGAIQQIKNNAPIIDAFNAGITAVTQVFGESYKAIANSKSAAYQRISKQDLAAVLINGTYGSNLNLFFSKQASSQLPEETKKIFSPPL
jgi:hypothetical protein